MTSDKIQPDFLKPGDSVAIISPSFCIDEDKLAGAVRFLEEWNLQVRVGKNSLRRYGPFAGNDEERLSDLQEMTNDPSVKAVLCSRGGYGLSRIINRVDFTSLKKNPKWYAGFSDITILHLWLSEVQNIMSIHSDMPLNYNNPEKTDVTFETLRKALTGKLRKIEWEGSIMRPANAEGEVTGGNLSLFFTLTGTPAEPATKGKILFIEDVGEYIYHLDRMLMSLKLGGKLEGLSALIIGGMNEISDTKIPWGRSVEETILDLVKDYDYPVLFDFPAGHISDNRAFYIGRKARIEIKGKKASLNFI
jgi:muramoyltetrapeptide carboxypeptidase